VRLLLPPGDRLDHGLPTRAGQKLGKFELLDTVDQGAFGAVYQARDPEFDRTVAIKVPRSGSLAGPQELDRFLREARSVAQLRHPSIVSIHEVGQADGLPYLVSDFVQGVTLTDLMSARRPGFREAGAFIAAVADALRYAHERGVVHRDVKPSNIMLGDDGKPYVMDFGLAKREAGEITMTIEGQVLGTPAYMSPEQARGEGHTVDGRSDVNSLGVILYQPLTGELPCRGTQRRSSRARWWPSCRLARCAAGCGPQLGRRAEVYHRPLLGAARGPSGLGVCPPPCRPDRPGHAHRPERPGDRGPCRGERSDPGHDMTSDSAGSSCRDWRTGICPEREDDGPADIRGGSSLGSLMRPKRWTEPDCPHGRRKQN
jgi:serine/threonine protein kinase